MNKQLKKIMTDLAAGHINQKEADRLMKPKKVAEEKPVDEIEGDVPQCPANVPKTQIKSKKEDKKSHKTI